MTHKVVLIMDEEPNCNCGFSLQLFPIIYIMLSRLIPVSCSSLTHLNNLKPNSELPGGPKYVSFKSHNK